jgi:hypothetical protein
MLGGEQSQLDRIEEDLLLVKEILGHQIIELTKSVTAQNHAICTGIKDSNHELLTVIKDVGQSLKYNTHEMKLTLQFQKRMIRDARMAIPVGAFLLLVAAFFGLLFGPGAMSAVIAHNPFPL